MSHQKLKLILIAIIIFCISSVVWYLPLEYKGHAPLPANRDLVIARNIHLSDAEAMESEMGAYLSSQQVKENGVPWSGANRLTYLIYSQIYDLTGFSINTAQYITIGIYALINSLLFLFIASLFGLSYGLIFSSLTLFTPIIWQGSLMPGYYEWGLLFFILGFIFYWLKQRTNLFFLLLAGVFFSLAILGRNAFFISVGAIGLFELVNKKSLKRIIIFSLPILLIVALPFFISYFQGESTYVNKESYTSYSHCFPDAYTFLFNKENYMQSIAQEARGDVLTCINAYGHQVSSLKLSWEIFRSARFYIREMLRLITYGGPIIWLLVLLGIFKLKKKNTGLLNLFFIWLPIWFIALALLKTSNWDHLLEIWISIAILAVLGISYAGQMLKNSFINLNKKRIILLLAVCYLLLMGHMLISCKWMFHEEYNTSSAYEVLEVSEVIKQAELSSQDMIAVNRTDLSMLNYYTDKNLIRFHKETIQDLIQENKLKDAFEKFGVTHVLGYSDELNQQIIEQTDVEIIK